MHLCCGRGTDTQTDKNRRQRSSRFTHAHTRPDIDMEAEEGKRKNREAEEGRSGERAGLSWGNLDKGPIAFLDRKRLGKVGRAVGKNQNFLSPSRSLGDPRSLVPK